MTEETSQAQLENGNVDQTTCLSIDEFPTDDAYWKQSVTYPAISVPTRRTAELRKTLKRHILQRPRTRNVYPDKDPNRRILVLQDEAGDDGTSGSNSNVLSNPLVTTLLQETDKSKKCYATEYTIEFGYNDLSTEDALQKLLSTSTIPADETNDSSNKAGLTEIPTSFELVGHLAHVNLRQEMLRYKYWIGKVLMDKNSPTIKTVVNKLGSIENEYRTFGMQVIAGNSDPGWSIVTVKEEGCTFELDFANVYWNSRLSGEHRRLVDIIKTTTSTTSTVVVADLMAGVGPFAVPLTETVSKRSSSNSKQSSIQVYANDLNPSSYKYLEINAKKNKCQRLQCYNMDAREFVRYLQKQQVKVDHVVMNLPASAPEFLDVFNCYKVYKSDAVPRIHVYCFAPKESAKSDYQDAIDRCATALNKNNNEPSKEDKSIELDRVRHAIDVHVVRDVSPRKNMLCISFNLPQECISIVVAEHEKGNTLDLSAADVTTTAAKRQKVDTE